MKNALRLLCAAAIAPALLLTSCISPYYAGPNETLGGVLGAATGAIAGGIIGHQSGAGLEGAAVGGVIGSWFGSAAGYSQDRYVYGYDAPRPMARRYYSYDYYDACPPRHYHYHRPHCW